MNFKTQVSGTKQAPSCPIGWTPASLDKKPTRLVAYWHKDAEGQLRQYWIREAIAN